MADRKVTVRMDLKPGDTAGLTSALRDITNKDAVGINAALTRRMADEMRAHFRGLRNYIDAGNMMRDIGAEAVTPAAAAQAAARDPNRRSMFAARVAGAGIVTSQIGQAVGGPIGGAMSAAGRTVAQGAAGFAAGGPIGAAVALIPAAVEGLKGLVSLPLNILSGGLNAITRSFHELGSTLGAGGVVLAGVSGLVRMVPLLGDALGGLTDSFTGLLKTGVQAAGLYSPGTTERFQMAKEDTMATVGRSFVPIVEALTELTRIAGDFLATVLPGTGEMREALAPLKDIFKELRSALAAVAPLLKNEFLRFLKDLQEILRMIVGTLPKAPGGAAGLNTSAGMAARNISFSSSAEDVGHQLAQAFYRGGDVEANPQLEALGKIEGHAALLESMKVIIDGIPDGFRETVGVLKEIRDFLKAAEAIRKNAATAGWLPDSTAEAMAKMGTADNWWTRSFKYLMGMPP